MEMTYKAEYYYEPHQRVWCAAIIDEDGNVVEYRYAGSEKEIIDEIEMVNKFNYNKNILSRKKTSFYK